MPHREQHIDWSEYASGLAAMERAHADSDHSRFRSLEASLSRDAPALPYSGQRATALECASTVGATLLIETIPNVGEPLAQLTNSEWSSAFKHCAPANLRQAIQKGLLVDASAIEALYTCTGEGKTVPHELLELIITSAPDEAFTPDLLLRWHLIEDVALARLALTFQVRFHPRVCNELFDHFRNRGSFALCMLLFHAGLNELGAENLVPRMMGSCATSHQRIDLLHTYESFETCFQIR